MKNSMKKKELLDSSIPFLLTKVGDVYSMKYETIYESHSGKY